MDHVDQILELQLHYYKYEGKYINLAAVTCFTLCSIKALRTAAVKSVHSVCAGPVVLTGMTCTVIYVCLGDEEEG